MKTLLQTTLHKKMNAFNDELLHYKIDPEADYFDEFHPNCTTILTNEQAALRRCCQLVENLNPKLFEDPDFDPDTNGPKLLYYTGTPSASGMPLPKDVQWLRGQEWLEGDCVFVDQDANSNDVRQGALGDCWFIGALSVLATRDELLFGSVKQLNNADLINQETACGISKGVYPPIFHPFARFGLYVFRFFKNAGWKWVIIDDRLPIRNQEGFKKDYCFAKCTNKNELWVPLIEKAYAKLHGCYESLQGGVIDDGLVDLTGLVAQKSKIEKE